MNTEDIFNNKGFIVNNPNFTGKTKGKKAQPPYTRTLGVGKDVSSGSAAARTFTDSVGDSWIMGDTHKYSKYGITPNKVTDNLDKELADKQSNVAKTFNAIGQGLYSQAFLGTIKSFPDLFDSIFNGFFNTDGNYQNPISAKIQEWQDYYNNEVAPIYTDPNVNITNGGLLNWGWYMSNLPSVMSSLTLLVPSMAVTKGVGLASKALKLGARTRLAARSLAGIDKTIEAGKELNAVQKGIGKFAQAVTTNPKISTFANVATNAAIQRMGENYQEAQGVYLDMYKDASDYLNGMSDDEYKNFINKNKNLIADVEDINNKDKVARVIAKKSADEDFIDNTGNYIFDVLQLYGLRGFWKGLKNKAGSASLNKTLRENLMAVGKTPEEIAKAQESITLGRKFLNSAKDKILGEKAIIAGELSEGLEEGVNYVSQMEGTYIGNVLMGKEQDNSFWDDRLQKYAQSGGLWDSMFWGIMGGVVFHHLGSTFGRLQATIEDNQNNKTNNKTGESNKRSPFAISETSEVKARKDNMKSWLAIFDRFTNNASDIENRKNPYAVVESEKVINNDKEQNQLRQRAEDEFITDLTLNAAHNGNLDYLKIFIESNEVRDALVKKGVIDNDADSKALQSRILDKMNEVQEAYTDELNKVISLADRHALKSKERNVVPIEALQSIATNNLKYRQKLKDYDIDINTINEIINNELANKDSELSRLLVGENIDDIKTFVNQSRLSSELASLYVQRSEHKDKLKDNPNDIGLLVSIDNINRQIANVEAKLNPDELREMTMLAMTARRDEKGNIVVDRRTNSLGEVEYTGESKVLYDILHRNLTNPETGEEDSVARNKMIEDLDEYVVKHGIVGDFTKFTDDLSIAQQYKDYQDKKKRLNKLINDTDSYALSGTTKTLKELLIDSVNTELGKAYYDSKIAKSVSDVGKEISWINQTMSDIRRKVINASNKVVTDIARNNKDNRDNIISAIGAYYQGNTENYNNLIQNLSDKDKTNLTDALDNLHLTSSLNYSYGVVLQDLLRNEDILESTKDSQLDSKEEDDEVQEKQTVATEEQPVVTEPEPAVKETLEITDETPKVTDDEEFSTQDSETQSETLSNASSIINQSQQQNGSETQENRSERNSNIKIGKLSNVNGSLKFESKKSENESDYNIKATNNNYEVTALNNKALSNSNLYEYTSLIIDNPNANIVEDTKPIISVDKEGNVNIIDKGVLKLVSENVEIGDARKEKPLVHEETAKEEKKQTTNSSKGREGNSETLVDNEVRFSDTDDYKNVVRAAALIVKQNGTIDDINKLREESITNNVEKYKDKFGNSTRSEIESGVNNAINLAINRFQRKGNETAIKLWNALNTLSEIADSVTANTIDFSKDFKESVQTIVNQYAIECNLPKVNNKHYGNYEDLLRYIESGFPDEDYAKVLFHALKIYFKSDEGKKTFVMTDSDEVDNPGYLNNVYKTDAVRNAEKFNITSNSRTFVTDISDLGLTKQQEENGKEALVNLKNGDKLTLKISTKQSTGTKVVLVNTIDNDGHSIATIGYLGIPNIDNANNQYVQVNDNLEYRVGYDAEHDGSLKHKLNELFVENDNELALEVRDAIYNTVFDKVGIEETFVKISDNIFFKELLKDCAVINQDKNYAIKVYKHLIKLAKFQYKNTTPVAFRDSINNWFNKLRESYNTYNRFNEFINAGGEFIAGEIYQGNVIRATDFSNEDSVKVAKPINEAIADITDYNFEIADSNKSENGFTLRAGQTVMTITRENGTKDYIQCFGQNISANNVGKDFIKLKDVIINQITDRYNYLVKNPEDREAYLEFKSFIDKILNRWNNSIFGFNTGFTTGDYLNINIDNSKAKNQISFARSINNDVKVGNIKISFTDKRVLESLINVIKNKTFNIDKNLLNSDNRDIALGNGIFSKDSNGKLHVEIPEYNGKNGISLTYDSFKDFIVKNNLVRVNLTSINGSNYNKDTSKVNIIPVTDDDSRPVKDIVDTSLKPSRKTTIDKVKTIILDNGSGLNIAKALITDTKGQVKLNNTKDSVILNKLFGKKVIFDDSKFIDNSSAAYAMYDKKGKQVVIGNKFFTLINGTFGGNNKAVRTIIHENIHGYLDELKPTDRVVMDNIMQDIYNDFANVLAEDNKLITAGKFDEIRNRRQHLKLSSDESIKGLYDILNKFTKEFYSSNGRQEQALEEFIVESLTHIDLMNYLNNVDSVHDGENRGNIWQRILQFIGKLFGVNVRKGSLREKELFKLADVFTAGDKASETNIESDNKNKDIVEEETPEETINETLEDEINKDSTSDAVINEKYLEEDNDLDDIFDDEFDDMPKSSIEDFNEYPRFDSALSALPLSEKGNFISLVSSGDISMICQ